MPQNPYRPKPQRMLRIAHTVHLVHEHDQGHYMVVCGKAYHHDGEAFVGLPRRTKGMCRECCRLDGRRSLYGLDEPPLNPVESDGKIAANVVRTRSQRKPRKRRDV